MNQKSGYESNVSLPYQKKQKEAKNDDKELTSKILSIVKKKKKRKEKEKKKKTWKRKWMFLDFKLTNYWIFKNLIPFIKHLNSFVNGWTNVSCQI